MQSDSSSSAKRSASEDPSGSSAVRATSVDHMASPIAPVSPHEIDAYMAEQGEDDISGAITLTQPYPPPTESAMDLSPPQRVAHIKQQRVKPMVVGDTWYLVSRRWYRRWEIACQGLVDKEEDSLEEKDIGPVDNTPLLDKDQNVISSLIEGIDVEFVPENAWSTFATWYGQPLHPLPRKVISRGILQEPVLELRPPRLKALTLKDVKADLPLGPPPVFVTVSTKDSVKRLCKDLAAAVAPRPNAPYRIWKIEPAEFDGSQYPASKLISSGGELLEESDKTLEESLIEPDDPFVVEFQENGEWVVDASKVIRSNSTNVTGVPPPLFSSENDFFSRLGHNLTSLPNSQVTPTSFKSYGFSKASSKAVQEPGTLGLGNMGNTCFMNSALQCLAHTKELSDYFLSGVYQEELNPDNPLGMHGAIAEAFGALLHRIWASDSTATSYSPREFKSQLQRFAPQFSGYQQHDSQELVAFLLDGLHEDLNRVLKKPYVEKPDWEGGGDVELVHLARNSWEGYMRRNDSVIVDLFQGQYQSTLVCPECQKVSITFDPFMYLTLPLPVTKKWKHTVFYVPWDNSKPHVKVPVEIGRDASFKDLRSLLGRWMDAPPENLLTLEIFNNRFYKNLDDSLLCGEMSDSDTIVCFELPCNSRQSRTYKKAPDDPFIVPVFLCEVTPTRTTYYSRGPSFFGYPFIAVVDQEQARSVEGMYDAVIERLQRWTANARDLFTWEAGTADSVDAVPIQITGIPPVDSLTEIKENGEIVAVDEMAVEEGDITDQKDDIRGDDSPMDMSSDDVPRIVGTKQGVFDLRLQINHKDYGAGFGGYGSNQRYESWENRVEDTERGAALLRDGDAFYCDFDENMKAYYFGDSPTRFEHARWDLWEDFAHPEYTEAKKASAERKHKGISLDDCLAEFTKEEQLGEDDLWYCPRCKKHQQATKKFDLWKTPDVLAVHLKRFSNSRALRDKIDTFVDFPIEGLDLGSLVGERQVGKRLAQNGVDIHELGIGDVDEPLVYDLFAVDEHIGGLGGGHYRAYAFNHITNQWYHFDDSYVNRVDAPQAVNSNAYLLFYKRRSSTPLGGKSHEKIEDARLKSSIVTEASTTTPADNQLPTPPSESTTPAFVMLQPSADVGWPSPQSNSRSSPASSPPPLDDGDPPSFEDSKYDDAINPSNLDPLSLASHRFDFPDPSWKASPTSSNEAEPDCDDAPSPSCSPSQVDSRSGSFGTRLRRAASWTDESGMLPSPAGSDSDLNPFSDANTEKHTYKDRS
ncbi:cysteine proteinase [Leucogyrophana mollusca]|uniref:Cysteine proteinase n=1 Tax=Leucogyrophana mollusca TaxID=85980 RepID=A0ACB8BQ53_9AGAM|nr:cysteine proteinase [Leucogyrophana mollusca]